MNFAGLIKRALPGAVAASVAAFACAAPPAFATDTLSVQPDGKIVVSGSASSPAPDGRSFSKPALVRFNSDGSLDTAFGSGGGLLDFRGGFGAVDYSAVATTSSGILSSVPISGGYRVARFESDGDVDSNFGTEGKAVSTSDPAAEGGTSMVPSTLLALPDGTILVGGSEIRYGSRSPVSYAVFADLLNADGSFASVLGSLSRHPGDTQGAFLERDLIRDADGSLTAVGSRYLSGGLGNGIVARLTPSGYDPGFASGAGFTLFPGGAAEPTQGTAIAATTDGYVAVGRKSELSTGSLVMVRLSRTGALDPGFGDSGIAKPSVPNAIDVQPTTVAVQPDGRIVVAGGVREPCGSSGGECWKLFLARFEANGEPDTTFGEGGFSSGPLPASNYFLPDTSNPELIPRSSVDLALLPGGSILAGASNGGTLMAARFGPDGRPDGSFGTQGVALASPCQGTVKELRKLGCLSHASANLKTAGIAKGRPRGRLRLNSDNLLDPMAAVKIVLPKSLFSRSKLARKLRVVTAPRTKVVKRIKRRRLIARFEGGVRGVRIGIRPGVLRRAKRVAPGRKLVFRVLATFMDRSTQRIKIRVAP